MPTHGPHCQRQCMEDTFAQRCYHVAGVLGIEVDAFIDEHPPSVVEDDGFLHVRRRHMRYVFNVGKSQSLTGREQNVYATKILKALGLPVSARALTSEEEEDHE